MIPDIATAVVAALIAFVALALASLSAVQLKAIRDQKAHAKVTGDIFMMIIGGEALHAEGDSIHFAAEPAVRQLMSQELHLADISLLQLRQIAALLGAESKIRERPRPSE